MTTVLEALTRAAKRIGIPAPASFSSNTKLLAHLYETNEDLRSTRAFRQQLQTWTIETELDRVQYPMPPDFYAATLKTQYDRTNSNPIHNRSDAGWNSSLYGIGSSPTDKEYRVFGPDGAPSAGTEGGQLQLQPAPPDDDVVSFDYIMGSTLIPPYRVGGVATGAAAYRSANGRIYYTAIGGTPSATITNAPTGVGTQSADGTVADWTWHSTPYVEALTNGDLLLFPEEVVVLGIIKLYFEGKREPFESYAKRYNDLKTAAISLWDGPSSIMGDGCGPKARFHVRPGSWSWSG